MSASKHSNTLNDIPISLPKEDLYGVTPFAKNLANNIIGIDCPIGSTLAINGAWGSGKSSVVNLISHFLEEYREHNDISIVNFKCLWYKGEEALTLAFFQELNYVLNTTLSKKAKKLLPKIGSRILQFSSPAIKAGANITGGRIAEAIASGGLGIIKNLFPKTSMESLFSKLENELAQQDRKFLIIIDDIDRLTPDEALSIFRLIKSVGRLPNIVYLLVFDRELAEKAVAEIYPSEGSHFLEKIIQASFDLPAPKKSDINNLALQKIQMLIGEETLDDKRTLRLLNIFHDGISPYLESPRDINRLFNAVSITWNAISSEVSCADFMAIETIRIFEPALYQALRKEKEALCDLGNRAENLETETSLKERLIKLCNKNNQSHIDDVLQRIFPSLQNTGYSHSFVRTWEAERLICSKKHFDTYFRMSLSADTLPTSEIRNFINQCNDADSVKSYMNQAVKDIQANGVSKVPLIFDELQAHSEEIPKSSFQSLISGLFEVADNILRKADGNRGTMSLRDNVLQVHWLIRSLTLKRCSLEERSYIFLKACEKAQLAWLVDFASSNFSSYFSSDNKEENISELLMTKQHAIELKNLALSKILNAAQKGFLISSPRLSYILFRWSELLEDDEKYLVMDFTKIFMDSDEGLSKLALAFTGDSWSHSMGSFNNLGDRVEMKTTRGSMQGLDTILDVDVFRHRLEKIESMHHVSKEIREPIAAFLEAVRRNESDLRF